MPCRAKPIFGDVIKGGEAQRSRGTDFHQRCASVSLKTRDMGHGIIIHFGYASARMGSFRKRMPRLVKGA